MKAKSILAALLLLVADLQTAWGQKMIVTLNDNSQVTYSISQVREVTFVEADEPVNDEHEYVDLGLPSGTKWATCNVGASKPEEYGDYFAWGETKRRSTYNWSTYKWCKGSETTLTKYCTRSDYGYNGFTDNLTELQPADDAATANWGSGWKMPSYDQFSELFNSSYTTTEWTQLNGVYGRKVTSKSNGNSIFLPAAGLRWRDELNGAGSDGYYWSSSLYPSHDIYAYNLGFNSGGWDWNGSNRNYGHSVRAVMVDAAEQTYTVNGVSFNMIPVTGGTFQMGSSDDDSGAWDSEKPRHQVTLSSFSIGETEVTQELWQAVMGSNPSYFKGNKLPVETVSWNDCQTFITKLNELTGKTFRLPTEAEWEYAARGGNQSKGYTYSGSNTIGDVAWYDSNSSSTTHVATKAPNELGIYDMSGNVREWCQDRSGSYSSGSQTNPTGPSSGSYRVQRGGSWNLSATYCRVAFRIFEKLTYTHYVLGLRLAQ